MKGGYPIAFTFGALLLIAPFPAPAVETAIYVNRYFEVRSPNQPTKYVFNGETRVARVTGSLSTNIRIQRFRLHPGWNLLSLAVSATNLSHQLQSPGVVVSAHSWNAQTGSYLPVPEVASSGMVLWVNAATNATLSVVGAYSDPVNREVSAGATYLSGPGLEAWTPDFPGTLSVWHFSSQPADSAPQPFGPWRSRLTGDLSAVNDLPEAFPPGQALYVINQAPFELEVPDPALRVRYYHQDHLGSSSVMTDASGALVEEAAFYPFGIPRHKHRVRPIEEPYQFTQKERDRESGLHYFEERYLAGGMSRFLSVDPKYANTDASTGDPQAMNLYAYVRNNPLLYTDPTGLEPAPSFSDIAHAAAVSDTRAAEKSDGASFSAGFGDAVLDVFTPNPYIYEGLLGGTRLGPDIRGALGINNVDSDSGYYTGGDIAGTIFSFATGAGEVRTALKGGTTVAKTLSKSGSVVDPVADTLKVTQKGWHAPAPRSGGTTVATGQTGATGQAVAGGRAAEIAKIEESIAAGQAQMRASALAREQALANWRTSTRAQQWDTLRVVDGKLFFGPFGPKL